jgi:hypothetical protein
MRIVLKHLLHKPSPSLLELLERELDALLPDLRVDEARVRFERLTDASPPFRVAIQLVTPGPDVMVETTDHTLRAALLKAFVAVRGRIAHRASKRTRRREPAPSTALTRRRPAGGARR